VQPASFEPGRHFHEEQEETYFVHRGTVRIDFGDGTSHVLDAGGVARVDAHTVRRVVNVGDEDAVYVIAGGKDGYVGRDGRLPEGETRAGSQTG
jgi:quercetin dioxygenase-like cupin family protein